MEISDVQKRFTEQIKYIDDTSQIVLKGHLVAEDLLNEIIETFVFHAEHIDAAKLQFYQKLELCRALSLSQNKNTMWNLLRQINVVRNSLAHSLDNNRRLKALQSLSHTYDQEFDPKTRNIDGVSEEAALCLAAISGALGFLHSFLEEVKRFKEVVKAMDMIMNKGE